MARLKTTMKVSRMANDNEGLKAEGTGNEAGEHLQYFLGTQIKQDSVPRRREWLEDDGDP